MSDNVKPIGTGIHVPGTVSSQCVSALENLLEMAKAGRISCLLGAALDGEGLPFEYFAGNAGTGMELIGQMHVSVSALTLKAIESRQYVYGRPTGDGK